MNTPRQDFEVNDARFNREEAADNADRLRGVAYQPRRSRWPGILGAGVLAAVVAALMVLNYYDGGTPAQAAQSASSDGATSAARDAPANNVAADGAITAAVKAALATDPALSALRIDVTTREGVVTLQGPAPDEKARQRAEVLAAAPKGVRSVENHLVLSNAPLI